VFKNAVKKICQNHDEKKKQLKKTHVLKCSEKFQKSYSKGQYISIFKYQTFKGSSYID